MQGLNRGCGRTSVKVEALFILLLCLFILNSSPVFAQITTHEQNGESEERVGILRYSSNPFEVDPYNISDVIEKAQENNYLIKINDEIINEMNYGSGKNLYIDFRTTLNETTNELYNETEIFAIEILNETYTYKVFAKKVTGSPYLFLVYFVPEDNSISIEQATSIVLGDLKVLELANDNTKIEFKEEYLNPITQASDSPNQIESLLTNNKYSFFTIAILIVLILVIAYFIKKRHGK